MLKDVTKMLTIREQEKDLLYGRQRHEKINILPVEFKANIDVPVPYILWNKDKSNPRCLQITIQKQTQN